MPTPSFAPAPPTVRSCRHTTGQQPTPGFPPQLTANDPATVTVAVSAVRCAFGELN
ncbi:hypothetical protein SAMN05660642_04782 [Geodermatophilus siccatus]|uniref:Uncharacterized protein n=1 Tax=Geodermatophilus siccatus TaxID=1137991 RepID=A0A1H0B4Y9_9ACTN|nr:hypothetical protein [Geodermatophilus siccatus]SDN40727.1 hypothetical protein SAMN05660642_04782 [Geodermatophilus siccatus]